MMTNWLAHNKTRLRDERRKGAAAKQAKLLLPNVGKNMRRSTKDASEVIKGSTKWERVKRMSG